MKTYLDIPMPLEVEHCKAAYEPKSVDVDGELAEEVDDGGCAAREGKPEYEGCEDDGDDLFHEGEDFHVEELSKLLVDLYNTRHARPIKFDRRQNRTSRTCRCLPSSNAAAPSTHLVDSGCIASLPS